jgi:hypothetical protein
VACSTKGLWTHLPVGGSDWTNVALSSSYPLLLDINFILTESSSSARQVDGILKALEGAPRARHIALGDALDAEHQSILAAAFGVMTAHTAPYLETFDVFDAPGDDPTDLPDILFDGEVPCLRTLVLNSVGFGPAQTLLRASLTTLHLRSCRTNMSIQSMLGVLANLPTLEDLSLDDTDFTDLNGDPLEERTCTELAFRPHAIALPRLRRLSFIDTVYMITTALLYLALPSDAVLELDCDCQSTTMNAAVAAMSVALDEHFGPALAGSRAFHELAISCSGDPAENITFELFAPYVREGTEAEEQAPLLPARVELGWTLRQGELEANLAALAALLPGASHVARIRAKHDMLKDAGARCELSREVGFSSTIWS